jgi:hypothetical protein
MRFLAGWYRLPGEIKLSVLVCAGEPKGQVAARHAVRFGSFPAVR